MDVQEPSQGRGDTPGAECFAAACSGTRRLSATVGRTVVLVGVAFDPDAAVQGLNLSRHGSAAPWPGGLMPLRIEEGWDDWAIVPIGRHGDVVSVAGPSTVLEGGRVRFDLPPGTTAAEVAGQLSAALGKRRLQDVVISAGWLEDRVDVLTDLVSPRYTPAAHAQPRGAALVEDLVVLDPSDEARNLLWLVMGARVAAAGHVRPWWA